MQGQIVYKEGFSVVGVAQKRSKLNKRDDNIVRALWEQVEQNQSTIPHRTHDYIMTGICLPPCENDYFYIAGIEVNDSTTIPKGMNVHTFPAYTYIQYEHKGTFKSLDKTYEMIQNNWLSQSGYQAIPGPTLEIVDTSTHFNVDNDIIIKIYIPIKIGQ